MSSGTVNLFLFHIAVVVALIAAAAFSVYPAVRQVHHANPHMSQLGRRSSKEQVLGTMHFSTSDPGVQPTHPFASSFVRRLVSTIFEN